MVSVDYSAKEIIVTVSKNLYNLKRKKKYMKIVRFKNWLIPTLIAVALLAVGVGLYFAIKRVSKDDVNGIIAIYAGVSGGLCTLIGVIITILSNEKMDKEKLRESFKPDFYMPSDCNRSKADRYTIFKKGTSQRDNSPILNKNLYFKNTDKTPFEIKELKCDDDIFDCKSICIDKNCLFCISFNYFSPVKKGIEILVISRDGNEYVFLVDEDKRNVFLKGDKENVHN